VCSKLIFTHSYIYIWYTYLYYNIIYIYITYPLYISIYLTIPLQEWNNPTESAKWRSGGAGPSPYKNHFAPLRQVPGCHKPQYILLDYCHLFHLGYGQDAAASTIILLCYLDHFGPSARKMDDKLAEAYESFNLWCHKNRRPTSIDEFSKQSFGMSGCLGPKMTCYHCYHTCPMMLDPESMYWGSPELDIKYLIWWWINSLCTPFSQQPRKGQQFPTSLGGKAFDTGVVMSWLQSELADDTKASWQTISNYIDPCQSQIL